MSFLCAFFQVNQSPASNCESQGSGDTDKDRANRAEAAQAGGGAGRSASPSSILSTATQSNHHHLRTGCLWWSQGAPPHSRFLAPEMPTVLLGTTEPPRGRQRSFFQRLINRLHKA